MTAHNLPDLVVLDCLQRVTDLLREEGRAITKTSLGRSLAVTSDAFEQALAYGVDRKHLTKDKGNYFSIENEFRLLEHHYYGNVQIALDAFWKENSRKEDKFFLERTANLQRKVSGRWTLPDFTLVSRKTFSWTIGVEFDVVTFEVKPPSECNVLAVFEALSHSRTATRSYVVFPVDPVEWEKADQEQAQRVKDECAKHGIGLIFVSNVVKKPKPVHAIKAEKKDIDHLSTDRFLESVLTLDRKATISSWKSI